MRTTPILLATFLLAATAVVLPTAVAGATCETADPVAPNDSRAGVVADGVSAWYRHLAVDSVSYTLTPGVGTDVDIYVYTDDCSELLCYSIEEGSAVDRCSASGHIYYRVEVYYFEGPGSYTISFSGQGPTACSDGIDNDGDTRTDYPADPGCASLTDSSEGGACPPLAGDVAVCLVAGDVIIDQPVQVLLPGSGPGTPIGHLDTYRFVVAGVGVNVPCVTLLSGGSEISPCRLAGGTFIARTGDLGSVPPLEWVEVASVRICHAELTAMVGPYGVPFAPAYTVC